MNNSCFIKKFKIEDRYYVYDVNKNAFLRVEESVFHILKSNDPQDEEITINLKKYQKNVLNTARKNIEAMKEKGFFLTKKPIVTFCHSMTKAEFWELIKDTLHNKLYKITLVVTEDCNLRCKYCSYSGKYLYHRRHSTNYMSSETMRKAVDFYFIHSKGTDEHHISFYGGEPLLNFKLIKECVNYVKDRYAVPTVYNMTINGTLLNKERIKYFAENNFSILISIDGPKKIHDRYRVFRNGKGSFNILVRNLRLMRDMFPEYYKKKVRFNMVLAYPHDYEAINEFLVNMDFMPASVKFSRVSQKFTTFYDQFHDEERDEQYQKSQRLLENYLEKLKNGEEVTPLEEFLYKVKYLDIHRRGNSKLPDRVPSHGQCLLGGKGLFIKWDGLFNFCSQVEDGYDLGSLDTGYNYENIRKIYFELEEIFSKKCYGCWAIRLCFKCLKEVGMNGSPNKDLLDRFCDRKRELILNEIKQYISVREKKSDAFEYLNEVTYS